MRLLVGGVGQDEVVVGVIPHFMARHGRDHIRPPAGPQEPRLLADETEAGRHPVPRVDLGETQQGIVRQGVDVVLGVEAEQEIHERSLERSPGGIRVSAPMTKVCGLPFGASLGSGQPGATSFLAAGLARRLAAAAWRTSQGSGSGIEMRAPGAVVTSSKA